MAARRRQRRRRRERRGTVVHDHGGTLASIMESAETPIPRTKVFSSWAPKRPRQIAPRHIRVKRRRFQIALRGDDVGFDVSCGGCIFRPYGFFFGFSGFIFRAVFSRGFILYPVLNLYY